MSSPHVSRIGFSETLGQGQPPSFWSVLSDLDQLTPLLLLLMCTFSRLVMLDRVSASRFASTSQWQFRVNQHRSSIAQTQYGVTNCIYPKNQDGAYTVLSFQKANSGRYTALAQPITDWISTKEG